MTKAKSKKVEVTNRGHAYELTAKGEKLDPKELGPQQAVIFPLLKQGGKTVTEMAAAVSGRLKTVQKPTAVVAFYLGQWKKQGVCRFAPKAKGETGNARKAEQTA